MAADPEALERLRAYEQQELQRRLHEVRRREYEREQARLDDPLWVIGRALERIATALERQQAP